jgi:3-deoxy-D-manno-octulosonate 8-phosphate phosphatase (KDO 8-P phosphatase)
MLTKIAKNIKLLILDCDGVLTDGTIYVTAQGTEMIAFNVLDGMGIELLQKSGVIVAVISGRHNEAVQHRLNKLNIEHVFLGMHNKITAFETLMNTLQLQTSQVAYVGDDFLDIPVMEKVALPITVPNATDGVKKIAKMCTQKKGGHGAVREVCDFIYHAQQS